MKKFLLMFFLGITFMAQAVDQVIVSYGYGWNGCATLPATKDTVTLRVEIHHWDYVIDEFLLELNMPEGLELVSVNRGRDLDMIVFDEDGEPYTYFAPLEVNGNVVSCKITDTGYEDLNSDGLFEPYGTIKFLEGSQEVLFIDVKVQNTFEKGTIIINGYFNSTDDQRLYTPTCELSEFASYSFVMVDYKNGDVNHDGEITISDVTTLIDNLMR